MLIVHIARKRRHVTALHAAVFDLHDDFAPLVIGQRENEAGAVSVRVHGKGNMGVKPKAEVVADILLAIRDRKA